MKPIPWHKIARDYAEALDVSARVIASGGDAYIHVETLEITTLTSSPDDFKIPPNLVYIDPAHTGMPFFAAHETARTIIEKRISLIPSRMLYGRSNLDVFVTLTRADDRKLEPGSSPNVLKDLIRGFVLDEGGFK